MKAVRFTETAEDSLFAIALWTIERFGNRQADVYRQDLVKRCTGLAIGDVPSQSCSILIGADLAADMRFARIGAHVFVFVEDKDEIVIMDFVHQREDFAGKLRALDRSR